MKMDKKMLTFVKIEIKKKIFTAIRFLFQKNMEILGKY